MPDKLPLLINRRMLISYTYRKFKRKVSSIHLACIAGILFEEMIKDIFMRKKIKIHNFGTICMRTRRTGLKHNVVLRKKVIGRDTNLIHLFLDESIKKIIDVHLDIDKTLEAYYYDKGKNKPAS